MSKQTRIVLLRKYLLENTCEGHVAKRKAILDYLASYEIDVHINTFYADLDALGDMGLDIEFDQHRQGYYVRNRDFEPYELRLMVDSIQASKFITKQTAQTITGKKKLTDRHTRATLNRPAVVPDRVRSINDSVVKDADKIYAALQKYTA